MVRGHGPAAVSARNRCRRHGIFWLFRRLFAQPSTGAPGAVVDTTAGRVRGLLLDRVHAFKGVPYGASTAGARRFLPPIAVTPWTGVRDAYELGPRAAAGARRVRGRVGAAHGHRADERRLPAPQRVDTRRGSRRTASGHGVAARRRLYGRFPGRHSLRRGATRAGHDVVVVSITHRLNVFGFMNLTGLGGERYADASNAGQKDLIAGLGLGPGQHRTLRRQSRQRDHLRTVGRRGQSEHPARHAGRAGPVPPRDRAKRFGRHQHAGGHRDASCRGADGAPRSRAEPGGRTAAAARGPPDRGDATAAGRGGAGGGFVTSPVVDGRSLPRDVFQPLATGLSATIPLLIGSTETEVTWNVNADYAPPADDAALRERVKRSLRTDDAQAADVVSTCRRGRPKASLLDLAFIIETDASPFRTGVDRPGRAKDGRGWRACLHVPLPMVLAGERRTPPRNALHGHPVRVRQHRQPPGDRRLRLRLAKPSPIG